MWCAAIRVARILGSVLDGSGPSNIARQELRLQSLGYALILEVSLSDALPVCHVVIHFVLLEVSPKEKRRRMGLSPL